MRKVEQFELMRRDFEKGLGVRAIASKHGVHRRKVREAIGSSVPPERKVPERACPVLTVEVKDFVEAILANDKSAPRKQRHTAHRIWQRVQDELGVAVAESTVRAHVGQRRRELGIGASVFVPQFHEIGAQAEADFYKKGANRRGPGEIGRDWQELVLPAQRAHSSEAAASPQLV